MVGPLLAFRGQYGPDLGRSCKSLQLYGAGKRPDLSYFDLDP